MTKTCPNCCDNKLMPFKLAAGIEVDGCSHCNGLWFEKGEVGAFAKFSEDIPNFKTLVKSAQSSHKNCPECQMQMKEIKYNASSKLMVDYCEGCGGVWFDGGEIGELSKISQDPEDIKLKISREIWKLRFSMNQAGTLKCPKCNTPTLKSFKTSEGVTVDLCDKCKGLWLDKGETAKSAEMESDFPDYKYSMSTARKVSLKCPKCQADMVIVKYYQDSALEVEHCEKCGGIFLDAGEISKVESVSSNSEAAGKKLFRCLKEMHETGYTML